MIQDGLESKQFHLGHKSPTQVPWSSSVHSLLSELPAVWEEGKEHSWRASPLFSCTSPPAEPLPTLLHLPFILQMKSNGDFHRSSLWRITFPAETLDQPPIFQLCPKFSSLRSWCLAWRKIERRCCLWFQWCVTSVVGFLFSPPLDVGSSQKVHLWGGFYSQYFNIPFLWRFVFYWLIHNDVILVVVISSLKTKGNHEGKVFERNAHKN